MTDSNGDDQQEKERQLAHQEGRGVLFQHSLFCQTHLPYSQRHRVIIAARGSQMQSHAWKFMVSLLAWLYAGSAVPQAPDLARLDAVLARFDAALVDFKSKCSSQRISAERCSCLTGKVKAIDAALAETFTDDNAIHAFLDGADRECVIATYSASVKSACLREGENSRDEWAIRGRVLDVEESCNCLYEHISALDEQVLRDDAALIARNQEARLKGRETKPYWSKIDQGRFECERSHNSVGPYLVYKNPTPRRDAEREKSGR